MTTNKENSELGVIEQGLNWFATQIAINILILVTITPVVIAINIIGVPYFGVLDIVIKVIAILTIYIVVCGYVSKYFGWVRITDKKNTKFSKKKNVKRHTLKNIIPYQDD